MTAGLRKVLGGHWPLYSAKGAAASSFLLERTKGQMWQVWATWWEGMYCSCRAGPAHTNIPGTAKEACLLHPAQTPGEVSKNWERAGQICNVLPSVRSSFLPALPPQARIPQQGSILSTWFCALNCSFLKPHSLRQPQGCSWGYGGRLLPGPYLSLSQKLRWHSDHIKGFAGSASHSLRSLSPLQSL